MRYGCVFLFFGFCRDDAERSRYNLCVHFTTRGAAGGGACGRVQPRPTRYAAASGPAIAVPAAPWPLHGLPCAITRREPLQHLPQVILHFFATFKSSHWPAFFFEMHSCALFLSLHSYVVRVRARARARGSGRTRSVIRSGARICYEDCGYG